MFKQTHVSSMYESSALSMHDHIYPHNKPVRWALLTLHSFTTVGVEVPDC